MNINSVKRLVDKKITELLKIDSDWNDIKLALADKMTKFIFDIRNEDKNVDVVELLSMSNKDLLKMESSRVKYRIIFVKESFKRKTDIDWIINRGKRFHRLNNLELFELVKFRDKLSKYDSLNNN
jgi:hypothetical protein